MSGKATKKKTRMFPWFGEGYSEDSGSCDDATQQSSDWSTAGEIPSYRCVSVYILDKAGRQPYVGHSWGWGHYSCHSPRHSETEDQHTSCDKNQWPRSQTNNQPVDPVTAELYFLVLKWPLDWYQLMTKGVCNWSRWISNISHHV